MNLTTANGKELDIINAPGTGHYKIQFKTGGELPESLSGLFTSVHAARIAAISYVQNTQTKKKSEAKE